MSFVPFLSLFDSFLINARTVLRTIARAVSKIGTPIASSGTPTETRNESVACEHNGSTATMKPIYIDPQSPRKTDAGL